jgi:hypothetical protein
VLIIMQMVCHNKLDIEHRSQKSEAEITEARIIRLGLVFIALITNYDIEFMIKKIPLER